MTSRKKQQKEWRRFIEETHEALGLEYGELALKELKHDDKMRAKALKLARRRERKGGLRYIS